VTSGPAYNECQVVFRLYREFYFTGYQKPGNWEAIIALVMMLLKFLPLFNLFVFGSGSDSTQPEDLTKYVNPFIGTEGQGYPGTAINGGNVFPGPALPFGVVKFGIDTTAFDWTNVDANAGYTPDGYGMSRKGTRN
jgi:putative alpha-1,2-mannosidase